jgi:hypothetical protein
MALLVILPIGSEVQNGAKSGDAAATNQKILNRKPQKWRPLLRQEPALRRLPERL